eukprot:PhM_4_TR12302/c0_g2_i1/m.76798
MQHVRARRGKTHIDGIRDVFEHLRDLGENGRPVPDLLNTKLRAHLLLFQNHRRLLLHKVFKELFVLALLTNLLPLLRVLVVRPHFIAKIRSQTCLLVAHVLPHVALIVNNAATLCRQDGQEVVVLFLPTLRLHPHAEVVVGDAAEESVHCVQPHEPFLIRDLLAVRDFLLRNGLEQGLPVGVPFITPLQNALDARPSSLFICRHRCALRGFDLNVQTTRDLLALLPQLVRRRLARVVFLCKELPCVRHVQCCFVVLPHPTAHVVARPSLAPLKMGPRPQFRLHHTVALVGVPLLHEVSQLAAFAALVLLLYSSTHCGGACALHLFPHRVPALLLLTTVVHVLYNDMRLIERHVDGLHDAVREQSPIFGDVSLADGGSTPNTRLDGGDGVLAGEQLQRDEFVG